VSERTANYARHFKEAEKILKSEFIKRCNEEIKNKKEFYRDRCKLIEGPELYRNQGKWIVLEEVIQPLFERIRKGLEKDCSGSVSASEK